jgi:hypothetical protein
MYSEAGYHSRENVTEQSYSSHDSWKGRRVGDPGSRETEKKRPGSQYPF